MNIVYTIDNGFVPQVATGICSIYENNKDIKEVNIYIISKQISAENKEILKKFSNSYGRELCIIELPDLSNFFDFDYDTKGWNDIVLARLILDRLLPNNIDKLLYLDGDTIVLDSLKELFDTNINDYIIGACIEPTVNKDNLKIIGLEDRIYCNAGVLLINFEKWKKEETGIKIINFLRDHNGDLPANDQDAINAVLKDHMLYLSPRYNYCNTYDFYNHKTLKKLMLPASFISKDEYRELKENPAIVHFLGEERPWREGNGHRFTSEYDYYLSKTPFKGKTKDQGWEFYFKCFHLFNAIVKPFPMLRYRIITKLIPLFMRYRAKQNKKK